jgi:uncharacterized membrane protein HdeD (DUF308 family)
MSQDPPADATLSALERGTASLPDLASRGIRERLAALFGRRRPGEPPATTVRALLGIVFGVAGIVWPDESLGVLLIVFGIYLALDAALAAATAIVSSTGRWRLVIQALVNIAVLAVAIVHRDFTRDAAIRLLAVWVVVMGAFRLREAIDVRHASRTKWVLAVLALLAIVGGASAINAPDDYLDSVMINVWIFPILYGVSMLASTRQRASRPRPSVGTEAAESPSHNTGQSIVAPSGPQPSSTRPSTVAK